MAAGDPVDLTPAQMAVLPQPTIFAHAPPRHADQVPSSTPRAPQHQPCPQAARRSRIQITGPLSLTRQVSPRASPRTRASPRSQSADSRLVAAHLEYEFGSIRSVAARVTTDRTAGASMVNARTLEENRSLVRAAPELQGSKRATLVGMLFAGGLLMSGAVELFVRCVLDSAFQPVQDAMPGTGSGRALSTSPQPQWGFTGSSLTDSLDDLAFADFQCLLTWFVCVVTGLGTEFFVGYEFLTSAKEITPWHEHAWFVAQFLFSIMILTAIQLGRAGNALAFIVMIAGMWKFGFPETLLFLVKGYGSEGSHWTGRLTGFMNAFGTLAHHSSSMLAVSILALRLSPLTRPLVCVSMPLVLQHIVVSVKYCSVPLYALLELLLEIYWQWGVFANMERFYLPHGAPVGAPAISPTYTGLVVRGVCGMLLAHWLYWAAAILDGIFMLCRFGSQDREVHDAKSGRMERTWHGREVAEWKKQFATYDAYKSSTSENGEQR